MNPKKLAISLILPQLAGAVGSLFTSSSVSTWYAALERPSFSPPNWVFGPVWFTLYVLMGVSVYLIWQKAGKSGVAKKAVRLFWIHLFFNATWSIAFFGMQNIALGFANILIIIAFIVALMVKFWKIDKRATYLLVPYLAWVSFATVLNYSLLILN